MRQQKRKQYDLHGKKKQKIENFFLIYPVAEKKV